MNENEIKNRTLEEQFIISYLNKVKNPLAMLSIEQVAKDLHIGINQAYELFKQNSFPTIKIGKRKMVSLPSYLAWKMKIYGKEM